MDGDCHFRVSVRDVVVGNSLSVDGQGTSSAFLDWNCGSTGGVLPACADWSRWFSRSPFAFVPVCQRIHAIVFALVVGVPVAFAVAFADVFCGWRSCHCRAPEPPRPSILGLLCIGAPRVCQLASSVALSELTSFFICRSWRYAAGALVPHFEAFWEQSSEGSPNSSPRNPSFADSTCRATQKLPLV